MATTEYIQHPKHECGTHLIQKSVPIAVDGKKHKRNTNYCHTCNIYLYGPPGAEDRFETKDPKEMGEYITKLIENGKFTW